MATDLLEQVGADGHWSAPFYTFMPARFEDIDQKCLDRFALIQIAADKKLLQMIGPCKEFYPDKIKSALAIVHSKSASTIQKISAVVVLDYCAEGWRDGVALEVLGSAVTRDDSAVFQWRRNVLESGGYKCARCGGKDDLQAHHIIRWVDMPEARLLPENGMSLCVGCHYDIHGKVYHG